ncbi:MAG: aldo/keto reductase [Oscillospiraceae bacterium]|nr:aldo/keto reductase [Oscillospiraceae bacterium]
MEKVRFGRTELMVTKVAFGGIPIQRLTTEQAVKVVRGVLDLGVNFIDTANGYTTSEERIGMAIKGVNRDSIVIATKSGAKDKKTFLENLDLSLKRLGVDYIDIYQHHGISSEESYAQIMGEEGAFEGMMEAVQSGKVRFPAFSSHSIPLSLKIMKENHFDVIQLPFNYVDDTAAEEAIPLAKQLDMGFIAMKPFGGGLLSNARLSMKYLSQFDNIVPDPGIEKLSEMQEIVSILSEPVGFTVEEAAAIEREKLELGDSWCHRCDYCQPCPQSIGISGVLTVESMIKRVPPDRAVSMSSENMDKARSCIECGVCMTRCPYNLNIPKLLKERVSFWDKYIAELS